MNFYEELILKFRRIVEDNGLLDEKVEINGTVLKPNEAIGEPSRKDYPILQGKEKLMQAVFKGEKGQAYTDMPGEFSGTIKEILERPIESNFDKAVAVSTLNAVCKYLKICDRTVHCKDDEPEECSKELVKFIQEKYGNVKVALIGLQPAMLERLSENFNVRVVDLDNDKIGKIKFGVEIENGAVKTEELLNWCDIILATGSTICNSTILQFLDKKPVIFFGTTIAAAAEIMNLNRFCACAK